MYTFFKTNIIIRMYTWRNMI